MPTYVRSGDAWLAVSGSTASSTIPSGSLMLFQQTSAPTGWTKETTHNDKALRVVSGSVSSGGTTAFTSVFTSRGVPLLQHSHSGTTGGHSADHSHNFQNFYFAENDGNSGLGNGYAGSNSGIDGDNNPFYIDWTTYGTNSNHTHAFTTDNQGTAGATMDFAVQYVDLIIAQKN